LCPVGSNLASNVEIDKLEGSCHLSTPIFGPFLPNSDVAPILQPNSFLPTHKDAPPKVQRKNGTTYDQTVFVELATYFRKSFPQKKSIILLNNSR
jgi:hypothetical protein